MTAPLTVSASQVVQAATAVDEITINPSGVTTGDVVVVALMSYQPLAPSAVTPPDDTWALSQYLPATGGYYSVVIAQVPLTAAQVAEGSFTFSFPTPIDVTAGVVCLRCSTTGGVATVIQQAGQAAMGTPYYGGIPINAVVGFAGNLGTAPTAPSAVGLQNITTLQTQSAGADPNALLQSVVACMPTNQYGPDSDVYYPDWSTPGAIPPATAGIMYYAAQGGALEPVVVSPTANEYVDASTSVTFAAEYIPNNGLAMGAYQLALEPAGGGTTYYWNGSAWTTTQTWVAATCAPFATFSLTVPAATHGPVNGNSYQWAFAFNWNASLPGNQGATFYYSTFTADATPTMTITAPTASSTVVDPNPVVTWTQTLNSGTSQYGYRLIFYTAAQAGAGGFEPGVGPSIYDTGLVASTATSVTAPAELTTQNGVVMYAMFVDSHNQASTWTDVTFNVNVPTPSTPVITETGSGTDPTSGAPVNTITVQTFDNMLAAADANPGASGIGGWESQSNCSVSGAASVLVMHASGGGTSMQASTKTGTLGYPVVAGDEYTALASFQVISVSGKSCSVGIAWYNASGGLIGTTTFGSTITDNTGGLTQATYTASAPTTGGGAAFAAVFVKVAGMTGSSTEVHDVADISLAPGNSTTLTPPLYAGATSILLESSPDGVNWSPLGYDDPLPNDVANTQLVQFQDIQAPIGEVTYYRAQSSGDPLGYTVESAWSSTESSTLSDPAEGVWWLCTTANPSGTGMLVNMNADPQLKPKEIGQMYYGLGDPYGTKVTDGYKGRGGILNMRVVGSTALSSLRALVEYTGTLMLRSPAGDVLYVQHDPGTDPIEASVYNTIGQGNNSYHNVQFQIVAVGFST